MSEHPNQVTMEETTDPVLIAQARAQRERFDQNWNWFQQHIAEIGERHRGRFLAIAGQELFVADTVKEVLELAREAHPQDDGLFTWYVPRERMLRIYADQWGVGLVQ